MPLLLHILISYVTFHSHFTKLNDFYIRPIEFLESSRFDIDIITHNIPILLFNEGWLISTFDLIHCVDFLNLDLKCSWIVRNVYGYRLSSSSLDCVDFPTYGR